MRFGMQHPAVLGVNFQPAFHAGRHMQHDPLQRMTIPDVLRLVEAQTILRPGQLLGTAALAGISQQGAFAEALERQTCVCDATADEFLRMMSAHPVLAATIMVTLARQAGGAALPGTRAVPRPEAPLRLISGS